VSFNQSGRIFAAFSGRLGIGKKVLILLQYLHNNNLNEMKGMQKWEQPLAKPSL
jgi:hypothetical protein